MQTSSAQGPDAHLVGRLAARLALAGGFLTIAVSVLVTASVLMRWITGQAVSGDFEIVQITTAMATFAYLPSCQWRRGNIVVDVFTDNWPKPVLHSIDAAFDILYAIAAAFISWRLFAGAYDAITSSTQSMVLGLPIGWAIGACAVMAGFLAIVAFASAFARFAGDTR